MFAVFVTKHRVTTMKENLFITNVISAYNQNKGYFKVKITEFIISYTNVTVSIIS